MIAGCLTTVPTRAGRTAPVPRAKYPSKLVIALVMLIWGVASEALRDIITGFLNDVRFD
jgi:hypothetical protein